MADAPAVPRPRLHTLPASRARLQEAAQALLPTLRSCATEADIVQVLYQAVNPIFGYEVIGLNVLEREGWYHAIAVDGGVLQDMQRRPLAQSITAPFYEDRRAHVIHPDVLPAQEQHRSRGPGAARRPRTVLWVPFIQGERVVGGVLYQTYEHREVGPEELAFFESVHRETSVLVTNAYLNELTRNQAVRLTALNAIARALSQTLDETSMLAELQRVIGQLLPVDAVELVTAGQSAGRLRVTRDQRGRSTQVSAARSARRYRDAVAVLGGGPPVLAAGTAPGFASAVWTPIKEGGDVRGALSIQARGANAYEESTLTFLALVADELALALRNAHNYAALEDQRRRLEVVNAAGRRLASSLDRWAIMRTLREELERHLRFDIFIMATVRETPDGPVADAYSFMDGAEQTEYTVPLASAGPSRRAYDTGAPVLVRRSPWARSIEAQHPAPESLVTGGGAVVKVRSATEGRVVARSLVWVPVRRGDGIAALLSLQSFTSDLFTDWHVDVLQDVAAHVSLALANSDHFAAAQAERRRLEALHVLELGLAGAGDERQLAAAVVEAGRVYLHADTITFAHLDGDGQVTAHRWSAGAAGLEHLPGRPPELVPEFWAVAQRGHTFSGQLEARGKPVQAVAAPVVQDGRVLGVIAAEHAPDQPFAVEDVALLESAGPVLAIALRSVRLHRANELALANSARMQEVAALAGHDLATVVRSIAELARTMLGAAGAACWALDVEGRVAAAATSGDTGAGAVLELAGGASALGRAPISGELNSGSWTIVPLRYADVLVGAMGSFTAGASTELAAGVVEFARHAAIAIENARLSAETHDRIRTLEALAGFAELDITRPGHVRAEMARLVERALAGSQGALWLHEDGKLTRTDGLGASVELRHPDRLLRDLRRRAGASIARDSREHLAEFGLEPDDLVAPVVVEGRLAGLITARAGAGSQLENRRLLAVLAGQAGIVLGRLRLVDALDRERRRMDAILRHSPVGVILEDAEGCVVYANPEAERLYRVPASSMAGREVAGVLAEAGAEVQSDPDAEPGAALVLRLSEPERVIEMRRVPIPGAGGTPASVLTLHEDVTRAREAMDAKDLMLRAVGHEVRSPAAAMRSTLAGLLQWTEVMGPEQRNSLLEEAYEMSDRLLSLVEGQLIIAKLETRRFEPEPEAVDVQATLDHVVAVLRHRYGDRVDELKVRFPPDMPRAWCEPTHLVQVLTNLIGNALEYTDSEVSVTARRAGRWLEVAVSDSGPGLPSERVQSLFRKAGPAGRNRARGGLGLGLYLCRLVVERSFGGHIWLDSPQGSPGSVFQFTVPAAPTRRGA